MHLHTKLRIVSVGGSYELLADGADRPCGSLVIIGRTQTLYRVAALTMACLACAITPSSFTWDSSNPVSHGVQLHEHSWKLCIKIIKSRAFLGPLGDAPQTDVELPPHLRSRS